MCFFASYFQIKRSIRCIVVHNDLIFLSIPFAGSVDDCTCVFQHRDYVRKDKRLCEQIFRCAKQTGALPSPFILVVLEIIAVTLPDCDMAVLQSS